MGIAADLVIIFVASLLGGWIAHGLGQPSLGHLFAGIAGLRGLINSSRRGFHAPDDSRGWRRSEKNRALGPSFGLAQK